MCPLLSGARHPRAAFAVALLSLLALSLLAASGAAAGSALKPPGKKIYWGVSDTGDPADFGQFADVLDKHPAVMQSFRAWGSDFDEVIRRWQIARTRPMIHISTADNNTGAEVITPAQIAAGRRRRVPRPPQQILRQQEDAGLRAAARRAQPLHQRLGRL